MDNPIHILIYYLFVFILSKLKNYQNYILDGEDVMLCRFYDIKTCEYDYSEDDIEDYKLCISFALFDDFDSIYEFPESVDKYLLKLYQNSILFEEYEDYSREFAKTYFDFYLYYLKLSANNEKYNHLYKILMKNLIIQRGNMKKDIENKKIDISQIIKDETFKEIAEQLFYKDLFENFSKSLEEVNYNRNLFFEFDTDNYNEELFTKEINKRFFNGRYTEEEVQFILTHHDNYNLQGLDINSSKKKKSIESIENLNKTEIEDLNLFLRKYKLNDIGSLIYNLNENKSIQYNIFDTLLDLCGYLDIDYSFRYVIIKPEENEENDEATKTKKNKKVTITSEIDPDSIYASSKSFSESIYNLIYDYYELIYSISVNSTSDSNYKIIYYYDEEYLTYNLIHGDTIDALMDTNFYYSIYSPIINLYRQYKNNDYIKEAKKLTDSLYNNYAFGQPMEEMVKRNITQEMDYSNEINYEEDIKEYDTIIKENTFMYLMDYEMDYHLYLPLLKAHIEDLCKNHNANRDHTKGISAKDLENYFNIFVKEENDNPLDISMKCNEIYDTMYTNWDKKVTESLGNVLENNAMKGYIKLIGEDYLFKTLISRDIMDKNYIVNLKRRTDNSYSDYNSEKKITEHKYISKLLHQKKRKDFLSKREDLTCNNPKNCREIIINQLNSMYETRNEDYRKFISEKLISMFPEDFIGKWTRDTLADYMVDLVPKSNFFHPASVLIVDIGKERMDYGVNDFKTNYDSRNLDRINSLSRDLMVLNSFKIQSCRNEEIKFLRLAKDYNRIANKNEQNNIELTKLQFKDRITDFHKKSKIKEINFNIIERPEQLQDLKNKFKQDIYKMFSVYLNLKYGDAMKNTVASKLPSEIINEITEFNKKLNYALTKETIFAKDIGPISEELANSFDKDNKEEYTSDSVLKSINNIMNQEFHVSRGYDQMITQINDQYFGCNGIGICSNYTAQTEEELLDNKERNPEKLNEYDKLSSDRRVCVKNIIYDSKINLNNINYSSNLSIYYYQEPLTYSGDYESIMNNLNSILDDISETIEHENVHNYVVVPKIYKTKDKKERKINQNEFVVFKDDEDNIQKPESENIVTSNIYDPLHTIKQEKEYVFNPEKAQKVYIAGNELQEGNLPKNTEIFVQYKDDEYDILTTDNERKLNYSKEIKSLYSVSEVTAEIARVENPDYAMGSNSKSSSGEFLNANSEGIIYSSSDNKNLVFKFNDNIRTYVYSKSILEEDGKQKVSSFYIIDEKNAFLDKVNRKIQKFKNNWKNITNNINKHMEKRKKNKNGKNGKN